MVGFQRFTTHPLRHVFSILLAELQGMEPGSSLAFDVPDPDVASDKFAGEFVDVGGTECLYRPWKVWVELAEELGCTFCTPVSVKDGFIRLSYRKWRDEDSWHHDGKESGDQEKYGAHSRFGRTGKFEEPSFLSAFQSSLNFLRLPPSARVLSLGVNQGDELAYFLQGEGGAARDDWQLVGVDHSKTAIETARLRLDHPSVQLHVADIRALASLNLGRFDLILSINTLHSPSLSGHTLLQSLVKEMLRPLGGLLIGLPNGRYRDHELTYGARTKNYSHPELSVLLKDVAFYRRYLQRQHFEVTVTGKTTVFITARKRRTSSR